MKYLPIELDNGTVYLQGIPNEASEPPMTKLEEVVVELANRLEEYIKKPSALDFARICQKENIDPITSGIIYNLFFEGIDTNP